MVAGAHADGLLVEQRGHVVRVDALDVEGHHAHAVLERLRSVDRHARDLLQAREEVAGEGQLVGVDLVHADGLEIVHRGAQSDGVHV